MPNINNPHDAFTQQLLSRLENAADFLQHYLPPKLVEALDLGTIELDNDTFVDEDLARHSSDLIYKVGLKGGGDARIVVLVDHKSDPEKWVGLQLLRYQLQIWQRARANNAEELPVVIPVVLYHGHRRWRIGNRFSSLFSRAIWKLAREFALDFKYHLCDLSQFRDDELKGGIELRAGLLLLKNIFNRGLKEPLTRVFQLLAKLPKPRRDEYLGTVQLYLKSAPARLEQPELFEALKESFHEEAEVIMETFADTWIETGKQIGLQQGLANAIITYLEWRFGDLDEIRKDWFRTQTYEKLMKLQPKVFTFHDLPSLDEWLRKEAP
jgi:predicted transposase/invertase (TIGR01784 family)